MEVEKYYNQYSGKNKKMTKKEYEKIRKRNDCKHNYIPIKQIIELLKQQAEEDLEIYIDEWESGEDGEVCCEAPLWRIELEHCESIKEIVDYMMEFGWSKTFDNIKGAFDEVNVRSDFMDCVMQFLSHELYCQEYDNKKNYKIEYDSDDCDWA